MSNPAKSPRVVIELKLATATGLNRLQGIVRYLKGHRSWDIRIAQNQQELLREIRRSPDGIIVSHAFSESTLETVERLSCPVVFIDIPKDRRRRQRTVDINIRNDDGGIGMTAAKYLTSIGTFRSYGYVPSLPATYWSSRRGTAFEKMLHAKKIRISRFGGTTERELRSWLTELDKPTAVFAAWDERARDVLESCHALRIRVPQQVVILGVDDNELTCTLASPELSSIRPDSEGQGFRAAQLLDRMMRHERGIRSANIVMRPLGVVERASTRPPAPASVLVDHALAFIRTNAAKGIAPRDVARHLRCSLRLLHLRFSEFNDKTVGEEITHVRLEKVKSTLKESSRSIASVAAECGFSNPAVLRNLFRRTYGISMRDYRKELAGVPKRG